MTLDAAGRSALRTRLTIGPLLLLSVLGVFLLDFYLTSGRAAAVVLGVLAIGGLLEYTGMMRGAHFPIARRFLLVAGGVLHAMPFCFSTWGSLDTELYPLPLVTGGLVFVLSLRALTRRRMEQGLEEMGSTLLGLVLLSWPLYFAQGLALRSTPALLYVVLVAKCGDIGGYFTGIMFGRHRLIPHVSPGKSVEGALGSTVAACLVAMILARPLLVATMPVGLPAAFALGLAINVTAQFGDLVESLLKRRCGVKDSSPILPVHGGVLDLVDSLVFAMPVFFFILVRFTGPVS